MIDISKYADKTLSAEILGYVKVEVTGNVFTATATDSFRLGRLEIFSINMCERLESGYYSPKAWKEITKIYNKKSFPSLEGYQKIEKIVKQQMAVQPDGAYPEIEKIIPEKKELKNFDATLKVKDKYFIDLLKNIGGNSKGGCIDWDKIKQHKGMIVYEDAETILLIMSMK